jgi:hypothetical protein
MTRYDRKFWLTAAHGWWQRQPPAQRQQLYRPAELTRATGIPNYHLPQVLNELGWHRTVRWTRHNGRRLKRVYYAPPGHRVPQPPRGRPTIHLDLIFGVAPDPCTLFPE